jgi:hypothetical protein
VLPRIASVACGKPSLLAATSLGLISATTLSHAQESNFEVNILFLGWMGYVLMDCK